MKRHQNSKQRCDSELGTSWSHEIGIADVKQLDIPKGSCVPLKSLGQQMRPTFRSCETSAIVVLGPTIYHPSKICIKISFYKRSLQCQEIEFTFNRLPINEV